MNLDWFCRKSVSVQAKVLKIKVRDLNAAKIASDRWVVYRGGDVGKFEGCCKWAAISKYLSSITPESDDSLDETQEEIDKMVMRARKKHHSATCPLAQGKFEPITKCDCGFIKKGGRI